MNSYLKNRKQNLRVNETFSEWEGIATVMPQDLI